MPRNDPNDPQRLMRFAADVVLRNGTTVRLRPVFASDVDAILGFLERLTPETINLRFCSPRKPSRQMAEEMAASDPDNTFGFVAESGGRVVGIAHYYRSAAKPDRAEVAFMVSDVVQGLGLGTRLLERLADVAREFDVRYFEAEVLASNLLMARVFIDSGFRVEESDQGRHFEMEIEPTDAFEDRAAERARRAAAASMKALFEPRSIAVVGAGRHRRHLGAESFHNLVEQGFRGTLHPVNPNASDVEGIPATRSVREIESDVDLAIVAVPQDQVEAVVDDCIAKGVRAILVMSAGFSESGSEGQAREMRLVEKIRAAGIRMVGPNSMGVINTDANVRMHGTFSPAAPPSGTIALSTQSGALGLAALDCALQLNIGFSSFISVGNKADVSGNDLVQYWAEDPRTEVILLYLESFGNPNKFNRIARRIARTKPIVAVKSGRSWSGARAALRHTGASMATDAIVADLFRQTGVIRTDTIEEMFDVAAVLANQPLPAGRRVAIVTNSGGPAILAADACDARGLELATFSASTREKLRSILPSDAIVENPVNVPQWASSEHYRDTMEALFEDPAVDALVVIHIPVFAEDLPVAVRGIREGASRSYGKTVVGAIMGSRGVPEGFAPLPCYPFPERAVKALARVAQYAEWKRRPAGRVPKLEDVDVELARRILDDSIAAKRKWLSSDDARRLLRAAGIDSADISILHDVEKAVSLADSIGYPVVLKAVVGSVQRDLDTAASRESIANAEGLRRAWADLTERFSPFEGIAIQKMIPDAIDLTIGIREQSTFGHILFLGVGTEAACPNSAYRIHPLTDHDADDMASEVRIPFVPGLDTDPAVAVAHVREALLRLSALLDGCPEIRELELSRMKLGRDGLVALEVHVRAGLPEVNGRSRRVLY